MRGERADHTLQPTALIHEAWLRLTEQRELDWHSRAHFVAMRRRLPADLDAVVLMALRKEPCQRYAPVDRLDADIVRFLSHRPVQARRPTFRLLNQKGATESLSRSISSPICGVAA